MTYRKQDIAAVGLLLALTPTLAAAQFTSGSDGSFGPIDVQSGTSTVQLPPDGVINATTVNVATGAVLNFGKNAANTPVYLLAQGDITIGGVVSVSAAGQIGGPGGFDGGFGQTGVTAGAGRGPGGGAPCDRGSYSSHMRPYGSLLVMPPTGGSGGGGCNTRDGGGGGGGILIASTTVVVLNGSVRVYGSNAGNTHGSGGAIRIVAPIATGAGALDTRNTGSSDFGRIRVDLVDGSQFNVSIDGSFSRGSYMQVFPPITPRLDIIDVAGTAIPLNSGPVDFMLPPGAPSSQDVVLQGTGFTGLVPITVSVTPESGDRVTYDDDLDLTGQVTVTVDIPENNPVRIEAWTR